MSRNPKLEIDYRKLEQNAAQIVNRCRRSGIDVVGVMKGVCGHPGIARSLLAGGVSGLADARMENIKRLRRLDPKVPLTLLRSPMPSEIHEVVRWVDISYQTEVKVMQLLSQAAQHLGRVHDIVLMIDVGDIRDGILPMNIFKITEQVMRLSNIRIIGVATNLGCYGGVEPNEDNLGILIGTMIEVENMLGRKVEIVSGGGSNVLSLLYDKGLPDGINHLRIGEAILLGKDLLRGSCLPGTYNDAFRVVGEVIEIKEKPSVPYGDIKTNAFGERPVFSNMGLRRRAIVALGRQDISPEGLVPIQDGITILGASSDHLILDIEECPLELHAGDEIIFLPNYVSLLRSMTSPYIRKRGQK